MAFFPAAALHHTRNSRMNKKKQLIPITQLYTLIKFLIISKRSAFQMIRHAVKIKKLRKMMTLTVRYLCQILVHKHIILFCSRQVQLFDHNETEKELAEWLSY